ncbi:hypothetical protein ACP4OV_002295 [Aristida adscensionis]
MNSKIRTHQEIHHVQYKSFVYLCISTSSSSPMAPPVKRGASAVSLVLLMAMAMAVIFFSYAAADYCDRMSPCDEERCYNFCLTKNYTGDFETYCMPGYIRPDRTSCCCRVPGA